ncbi:KPN_02809 family neutral zinc metallopeptidase [Methylophilus aquaticus]|uniref:Neutral zinc metallopeptidase n=1 Tax=Methylophilus aquaticus TaxID=1971610 RepID=A0ABT9JXT9_9PROT|nr:neutral zinc metallopeptidase [Methylophilus aquaticus]MDP8568735.1 neutral zinc metallopeptidase [Methylophilus aquaticus]
MRLDDLEESQHIEDRRGGSALGGRSIGLGTIAIALVAMYFGVDPNLILNVVQQVQPPAVEQPASNTAGQDPATKDPKVQFVSKVLWSTEQVWQDIFTRGGQVYVAPRLEIFTEATQTACGQGQAAMGPFYCPADQKVYIDLHFYQELQSRFKAPGDFSQAYVIAHEVGHHVQNLLGTSEKVQQARQQARSEAKANAYSVRLELQADCYAGVWAHHADQAFRILETGDVEEALRAATAIGDDALQKQAQGYVVPDSFTHGTSEQRVHWFQQGLHTGDVNACNTFKGAV